jgi:hypothetical protein
MNMERQHFINHITNCVNIFLTQNHVKPHQKITIFDLLKCTLHKKPQLCFIVQHSYMKCHVNWNVEGIKFDDINVYVIFNMSIKFDISEVRMLFGLANWVLARVYRRGEIEAELCFMVIVFYSTLCTLSLIIFGKGEEMCKGYVKNTL